MITAIDSSVLIDIFRDDVEFAERSAVCLRRALAEGSVVACDVVWAEVAAVFGKPKMFRAAMETLEVQFSAMMPESAEQAGTQWCRYRARGGKRERVMADFLVGAHALRQCDRLLSRDRGFYRAGFEKLKLMDPTAARGK